MALIAQEADALPKSHHLSYTKQKGKSSKFIGVAFVEYLWGNQFHCRAEVEAAANAIVSK